MFEFNKNIIKLIMAPILRLPKLIDFICGNIGFNDITTGLAKIYDDFMDFRTSVNLELPYSGQTMSLEHLLSLPRPGSVQADVTIVDGERTPPTYLSNNSEPYEPFFLSNQAEAFGPVYFANVAEFAAEFDFVVEVNLAIGENYINSMKPIIDRHKVAGKTYKITGI